MISKYLRIHSSDFKLLINLDSSAKHFLIHSEIVQQANNLKIAGGSAAVLRLIKYNFLDRTMLLNDEITLFKQNNVKFKYFLTNRAKRFINIFIEDKHVFDSYEISDRAINLLYFLTDQNKVVTFKEIKDLFIFEFLSTDSNFNDSLYKNYVILINNLIKSRLINKQKNKDELYVYWITELGKNVLDLSEKVNKFLRDEEHIVNELPPIMTEFKTKLIFPLWV